MASRTATLPSHLYINLGGSLLLIKKMRFFFLQISLKNLTLSLLSIHLKKIKGHTLAHGRQPTAPNKYDVLTPSFLTSFDSLFPLSACYSSTCPITPTNQTKSASNLSHFPAKKEKKNLLFLFRDFQIPSTPDPESTEKWASAAARRR